MFNGFCLFAILSTWLVEFGDAFCKNGIIANGVSKQEEELILNKHNEIRQLVACGQVKNQPKGVNLKKLKYSKKLAEMAQQLASECIIDYVHGTDGEDIGHNGLVLVELDLDWKKDWNKTILQWYDENVLYSFGYATKDTEHYTQLVWADTEYVGCAYALFQEENFFDAFITFYICYYEPRGNESRDFPYKTDDSSSKVCAELL